MAAAVPPPLDINLLVERVKTASRETFKPTLISIMDQGEFKDVFSFIDTFDSRKIKFLEALAKKPTQYLELCHRVLEKEYQLESDISSEFHPIPLSRNTKTSPILRGVCHYVLVKKSARKPMELGSVERGILIQVSDHLKDTTFASAIMKTEYQGDYTVESDSQSHPVNMYCDPAISDTLRALCLTIILEQLTTSDALAVTKSEGASAATPIAALTPRKKEGLILRALENSGLPLVQLLVREGSLDFLPPDGYAIGMRNFANAKRLKPDPVQKAATLGLLYRCKPASVSGRMIGVINNTIVLWLQNLHAETPDLTGEQLQYYLETFLNEAGPSSFMQLLTVEFLVKTYNHCQKTFCTWAKLFLQKLQTTLHHSAGESADSERGINSRVHKIFSPLFHAVVYADDAAAYSFLLNEEQCGFKFNILDLEPIVFHKSSHALRIRTDEYSSLNPVQCIPFNYARLKMGERAACDDKSNYIFKAMLEDPIFNKMRSLVLSFFLPAQYLQSYTPEENFRRPSYSKFQTHLLRYLHPKESGNLLSCFINTKDLFDPEALAYCVEQYLELHQTTKLENTMIDRICQLITTGQVASTVVSLFDLAKKHFPTIADALERKRNAAASGEENDDFAVLIRAATRGNQRMKDERRRADILESQRTTVDSGLAKLEADCSTGKITIADVLSQIRALRAELAVRVVAPPALGEAVHDCFAVAQVWTNNTVEGCKVVVGERSGGGSAGYGAACDDAAEPRG